ncbi:MAG: hypothetical protein IPP77_09880 [Bacteroidetes bacterium]|nr:hypothetical protein [Bacteroidota bacterium]
MASNAETGHTLNIFNFKKLHDKCDSFGPTYQPGNPNITVANLFSLWSAADGQNNNMNGILANSKVPINQRVQAFEPLNKIVTNSFNYLKSASGDKELIKDCKGYADKIRGSRVKKPVVVLLPPDDPANPNPDWVSNSHLSYVQRITNFKIYIDLLATSPEYTPNEATITIANLNPLYDSLKAMNDNIEATVIAPLEAARNGRNHLLYDKDTGLIDISLKVKDYVKSLFGSSADETKQVVKMKLVRFK